MGLKEMTIKLILTILALSLFESCHNEIVDTDEYTIALTEGIASNKIIFWGHSAGRILEPFLEDEIDNITTAFEFERCSVDGEKMLQIAARQGSIPPYFLKEDCLKIGNKYLIANEDHPLASVFDGSAVPFSIINGVNPCIINNVAGKISRIKKTFYFEPDNVDLFSPDSINIINTSAALKFRYPFFTFFWCDQLVDRNNVEALLKKYRIMTEFTGNDNYLIIGSIRGDSISHKEVEIKLLNCFNEHYFNARSYLVSEAKKEYMNFSVPDRERINKGSVPLAWMKDTIHLNNKGAIRVAREAVRLFEDKISLSKQ